MKILSVVGARPQFIKLGPLSRMLRKSNAEKILHTGQHFDDKMSKLFFADLAIPTPDYFLGINSGNHGEQTGRMLIEIEKVIVEEKPDIVLTFGDTNSTLAGTLAASKLSIKTLHIEAGLRSFNRNMPEELNRIVADHTSDLLFAPTINAMHNLKTEGLQAISYLTGDVMVDSLNYGLTRIDECSILSELGLKENSYYLLTLHRPYNVDNPEKLSKILNILSLLEKRIVFPIHPRTHNILSNAGFSFPKNILAIHPTGYLDFLSLQKNAFKILTDSGGVQKEAYILKKPCLTIRSETEWVETVEVGWNILVDVEEPSFIEAITNFHPPELHPDIFGTSVSDKMCKIINNL